MPRTLLDALTALDSRRVLAQAEYVIYRLRCRGREAQRHYLMGIPYRWTLYRERAFTFGSRKVALALIAEFPVELAGCQVAETILTRAESN